MFRNKEKRRNQRFQTLVLVLSLAFGMFLWCGSSVQSFALGTAKVVASSGRIREKADKTSDTVGSVEKGNTLDVISQTTDADGYTWYKVYVNKEKTGYIRADLVTVEGTISTEEKTSETKEETEDKKTESSTETTDKKSESNTETADKNEESGGNKTVVGSNNSTSTEKKEENKTEVKTETVVVAVNITETDVTSVKVTDSVRVRKGAGTNFDVAEVAEDGTIATVSGIAADSEGKNWYQVSFNKGNKTVNGFIREDLVEVVERIESPVEEEAEEEITEVEEPVVENADYHLQYMPNDAGEMDWFLFDNIQGTKQSLSQLLEVVEQANANEETKDEQGSTMRMIIIAMAVVVVVLIIVVTILIFKLRDADYEYEDDDDEYEDDDDEYDEEDDEEDEDDDDEDDDNGEHDEEDEIAEKKIKAPRIGFFRKKEVVEETEDEEDEEEEEEMPIVKPQTPAKETNKSWQSKDFLELDDDMEFEFLDL